MTSIIALMMLLLRPANTPRWSLPRGNHLVPSTWRATGARFDGITAARLWLGLFLRSYRLLGSRSARYNWLTRAAQQAGRVAGGLKQSRLYF